jgi:hypothetical protein
MTRSTSGLTRYDDAGGSVGLIALAWEGARLPWPWVALMVPATAMGLMLGVIVERVKVPMPVVVQTF